VTESSGTVLRAPGDLRALLGVPFTDEQLAAAAAPLEPGVIVAGAGSGKTAVMAARVVWLVGSGQVEPDQVLGLTFTNKAAGELAGRVRTALDSLGAPAAAAGEPAVSTYHAYAGRLVQDHGLRIGVEPASRLLADATRFQLAQRVLRVARGPFTAISKPLWMLVGDLVALEAELSEHLVSTETLRAWDRSLLDRLAEVPRPTNALREVATAAAKRLELATLVDDFRAAKRQREVVDFGDQMALAAGIAESRPEVGTIERERFRVVLLDEYQDTSVAQRRLLAGLFGGGHPVTAVGDPCQAIYGWRGASVANLDAFPTHFRRRDGAPAARYALTENRRSGGRLLALANTLAAPLRDVHAVAELVPCAEKAAGGETVCALFSTYDEEIGWAADQAAAAVAEGTPPGEVAVLVRARSDFPALHAALTERGLPVEVVGLGGLLSLPEVADLVATLQVLDDPTTNAALVRLLTGPRWRIGPRDLALLGRRARDLVATRYGDPDPESEPGAAAAPSAAVDGGTDEALEQAVAGVDPSEVVALADALERPGRAVPYSAPARRRFAALAAELAALRRHLGEPLLDLVQRVVTTTGLDVELAASPQAVAARRRESVAAFLDHAGDFVGIDGEASVTAFLAFLRAAEDYERGLDSTAPSGADSVKVLTAHKAKGLEWDVVVVPGLSRGVFPSFRGRERWTSNGHVLPFPLRGDFDSGLPDVGEWSTAGVAAFGAALRAHTALEERRLGYVAVTRARRRLVASGHWWGPTQKRPRGPSDFLVEISRHCAAASGTVAAWAPEPGPDERNPQLEKGTEWQWPAPLDAPALAARRAAAAAVHEHLRASVADAGWSPGSEGLDAAELTKVAGWDRDAALLVEELRGARRVERVVELPRSLSASQLLRLAADPAGLARDLARPMPRPPAPAARRGTRFHAWVEARFAQQPLLDPDELPGAGDSGLADVDLAALQEAFLRSDYADRRPHQVEAPFQLVLAGRVVRGRVDAVYRTQHGYEVVDWKTGSGAADELQLAVYRLAWAELAGVPLDHVDAVFLHVRTGEVVRPESLPGREELEALLRGAGARRPHAGVT